MESSASTEDILYYLFLIEMSQLHSAHSLLNKVSNSFYSKFSWHRWTEKDVYVINWKIAVKKLEPKSNKKRLTLGFYLIKI